MLRPSCRALGSSGVPSHDLTPLLGAALSVSSLHPQQPLVQVPSAIPGGKEGSERPEEQQGSRQGCEAAPEGSASPRGILLPPRWVFGEAAVCSIRQREEVEGKA